MSNLKLLISLFLAFSLLSFTSWSQDTLSITGNVVSKKDKRPVAYAHISISASTIGTISNNGGNFSLTFGPDKIGDTLIISSIGYKTQRFTISQRMTELELEVQLAYAPFTLSETVVEDDGTTAHALIQKAISKIPENYDNRPVMLTQFYREYLKVHARELHREFAKERKAKKKNENFDDSYAYNVTEGLFHIYKIPYHGKGSGKNDKAKLLKGRRIAYVPQTREDSVIQDLVFKYPHKGGPHDMLKHDILKDPSDANFLKKRADKKYEFKMLGLTEYNGRGVFKISFDQKPDVKDALYKGVIYIDTANYAFLKFDFTMSPRGIDHQSLGVPGGLLKFMTGIQLKIRDFHATLTYQQFRGKWYPEYYDVAGTLDVVMDKDKKNKELKIDASLSIRGELLVTNIDKHHVKEFDDDELFKGNDTMDDFVSEYDDTFWKGNNYILPTDQMIQEINKRKNRVGKLN